MKGLVLFCYGLFIIGGVVNYRIKIFDDGVIFIGCVGFFNM